MLKRTVFFSALLLFSINQLVMADNEIAPHKPLSGSVLKVELDLEKLRNIGLDLKHVAKAASLLYDEVNIQPMSVMTQPEIIGSGTVINLPVGVQPAGPPEPVRKEAIDLAVKNIKPFVDIMKKDVDEFIDGQKELNFSPDLIDKLKPEFDEWIYTVKIMASHESELEKLAQAPPYDNRALSQIATFIQEDVKSLDKTRMKIYKVIRKEGKHTVNEKST